MNNKTCLVKHKTKTCLVKHRFLRWNSHDKNHDRVLAEYLCKK